MPSESRYDAGMNCNRVWSTRRRRTAGLCMLLACLSKGCATGAEEQAPERISWSKARPAPVRLEFHVAWDEPSANLRQVQDAEGRPLHIGATPLLTEDDIIAAEALHSADRSVVQVRFSSVGAARLQQSSASSIGKHLAILLDDKVIASPLIQSAITHDTALISGRFTRAEAEQLASRLRGEAAPEAAH